MSYTVCSGDNLTRIAQAQRMTLRELLDLNPQIKNPDLIHPGQKITIVSSAENRLLLAHPIQFTHEAANREISAEEMQEMLKNEGIESFDFFPTPGKLITIPGKKVLEFLANYAAKAAVKDGLKRALNGLKKWFTKDE